jgi:hypothetical protein
MQRQRLPFGLSNDHPPLISTSDISITPQPLPLYIPHPDPAWRTETLERHRHDPEAQMVCGKSSRGPNRWSTARSSPTGRAGTDQSGRLFHIRCPMFLPALHLTSHRYAPCRRRIPLHGATDSSWTRPRAGHCQPASAAPGAIRLSGLLRDRARPHTPEPARPFLALGPAP